MREVQRPLLANSLKGSPYRSRSAIDPRVTRFDSTDRVFVIALAALAGYVDAIGFLATGGFFVSFMSGNTTRLGVGLASIAGEAGIAARLILLFVGGVTIGTLIARRAGAWRRPAILGLVAALVALAAALGGSAQDGLAVAALALAMGLENTVLEGDGEVRVGITYMTGTLVRLGQQLAHAIAGGAAWDWVPHLLLWSGLMSGAWIGAACFMRFGFASLWVAVSAAVALAVASLMTARAR